MLSHPLSATFGINGVPTVAGQSVDKRLCTQVSVMGAG